MKNKQHIQVANSYNTWSLRKMKAMLPDCSEGFLLIAIEWWLHNIGYWVTLPLGKAFEGINARCKDVDLMIGKGNEK